MMFKCSNKPKSKTMWSRRKDRYFRYQILFWIWVHTGCVYRYKVWCCFCSGCPLPIDPYETSGKAGGFNEWKCYFTMWFLFSLDAQTCLHNICSCLKCTVLIGSWWRQDLPSASDCISGRVMGEDW